MRLHESSNCGLYSGVHMHIYLYAHQNGLIKNHIVASLQTNQYLEHSKPWVLAGDPTQWGQLEAVLRVAIVALKTCNLLLYPVVPEASQEALCRLGVGSPPQFGRPPLFNKYSSTLDPMPFR